MTTLCSAENPQAVRNVGAALLLAGVLSGPGQPACIIVPATSAQTLPSISLHNSTAQASCNPLPQLEDVEVESPNFVPEQLVAFAASGYERRNRWA